MKKFLPVLILVITVASALAYQIPYTAPDGSWAFNDGVFTFNSNYVWTGFALREDKRYSQTSNFTVKNLVEMGYYEIEDGKPGEFHMMFQRDASGEMAIQNSVILEKGDQIGIYAKLNGHWETQITGSGRWKTETMKWVIDEKPNTWTTTQVDGAQKNTNNVDNDSYNHPGQGDQYFCLFLNYNPTSMDHFEYYLAHVVTGDNYDDFIAEVIDQNTDEHGNPISNITDSNGKPVTTGQPLPGLLLTLACGGAATGLCTRKRKRSAKA